MITLISTWANSSSRKVIGCMDKCYPKKGQLVDNPWSQAKYGADQPSTDEPTVKNGPIGAPDTGGGNSCPKVISFDTPLDLQASNSEVFATDETSFQTIQPPDTNPSGAIAINAFYDPGTTHAFGDETIESSSIEKTGQELIGPIVTASNLVIPQYDENSSSETNPFFIHDWKPWGKMRRSARDFHPREDTMGAIGTRGFWETFHVSSSSPKKKRKRGTVVRSIDIRCQGRKIQNEGAPRVSISSLQEPGKIIADVEKSLERRRDDTSPFINQLSKTFSNHTPLTTSLPPFNPPTP